MGFLYNIMIMEVKKKKDFLKMIKEMVGLYYMIYKVKKFKNNIFKMV